MTDNKDGGGRAKGGFARAKRLTAAERSAIAKKAAGARWEGNVLKATHGDADHPLVIGDVVIPCYVLEDGTRVLSQRGMIGGLGMAPGTPRSGADRLTSFAAGKGMSAFVSSEMMALIESPIKFTTGAGGGVAYGYPATLLADLCDAVLAARKAGALQKQQEHIASQAELLVRGFARVGIIALVDEATGYQRDRASDALAKILEAFIDKELRAWVQTFPADFYQELFRLRGLAFPQDSVRRPQYFGTLTNDIVYRRIAPGVLAKLKEVTPRDQAGRLKHKYFQRLTSNVGYPKLLQHLGSVVSIMKLSDNWSQFIRNLDRLHPRYGDTLPLPLDDGNGI